MSIAEKLKTIADNQSKVYDAGKKAEYDEFWDNYQDNGNRMNYSNGFAGYGKGWNVNNFYPKYDMKPDKCGNMFYAWEDMEKQSLNLTQRLKDCNVTLDTSASTQFSSMFAYSKITHIPTVDLTSASGKITQLFYSCPYLVEIEKLKIHENIGIDSWFNNDTRIEKLEIEGKIGQDGFNVRWCKNLSRESILSILKALSLGITETKTITFSTEHQTIIENDADCKPYWESAKSAGWSFVYA